MNKRLVWNKSDGVQTEDLLLFYQQDTQQNKSRFNPAAFITTEQEQKRSVHIYFYSDVWRQTPSGNMKKHLTNVVSYKIKQILI